MRTNLRSAFAPVVLALSAGCGTGPNLTPARDIVGTWRTAFPVTFHYETDWCDHSTLQLMLTEKRLVTFDITDDASTTEDNDVLITMGWTESDFEYVKLCMDNTGITPDVRPMFLTGTVSGAYLTVRKGENVFGEFSFTTSNMEGNWNANACHYGSCQRIYTVEREFKLNKVD